MPRMNSDPLKKALANAVQSLMAEDLVEWLARNEDNLPGYEFEVHRTDFLITQVRVKVPKRASRWFTVKFSEMM